MLTGSEPTQATTVEELYRKIKEENFKTSRKYLNLSSELKDLLLQMLKIDPNTRITAAQVLNHPWIKNREKYEDFET